MTSSEGQGDRLEQQLGHLTEEVTALRLDNNERLDQIIELLRSQGEGQSELRTEMEALTRLMGEAGDRRDAQIDRLLAIVEALVGRN